MMMAFFVKLHRGYSIFLLFKLCARNVLRPKLPHPWWNHSSITNDLVTRTRSTTTIRDKTFKKIQDKLPSLQETDLQESFQRGSGPGGQSVNKTNNCVVLKHLPTGLVVKCHQTRSLEENRKIARLQMRQKLDEHLHGEESAMAILKKQQHKNLIEKKRRAKIKQEKMRAMKEALKEKEGPGD